MGNPTRATTKRLFAVSGNCCAFPKCTLSLIDTPSGKVTGRIAHIKARQPRGPRYDEMQSEEQRHDFDNLLLLCPIHHDVIDADPDSYTVERLTRIKSEHESAQTHKMESTDSLARQFIANATGNTVTHGSIILSQNQLGGQIAHSIQNFGPQPRQISSAAAQKLVAELSALPAEEIELTCTIGDAEGFDLATNLKQILELSGWTVEGVSQALFVAPIKGVLFETPAVRPSFNVLLNWLVAVGLRPKGIHHANAQITKLIVGTNL